MTFSVSAGVYTKETDLSFVAEQFVATHGSFAGKFMWGPCLERVRVSVEEDLVNVFQKPSTNLDNAIDFLTASSFLGYSNALDVVRLASYNGSTYLNKNAIVKPYFNILGINADAETDITILNDEHYTNLLDGDLENNSFVGRFTGELGNSIGVSFVVASDNDDYNQLTNGFSYDFDAVYDAEVSHPSQRILGRSNDFYFSRDKNVYFKRFNPTGTVRSLLDIGDWLDSDGVKYQIKNITLGTEGQITHINVSAGGTGYVNTPTLAIVGTGSGATATATLAATGSVKNTVTVLTGGTYVDDGVYDLIFTGGGGTGAVGTATVTSGIVASVSITTAGTGYATSPVLTLDYTGTGTPTQATFTVQIGRAIASATVVTKGSGYTGTPTINITGSGSGATLVAVIGTIDILELDRIFRGDVSTGDYLTNTVSTPFNVVKFWRFCNVLNNAPLTGHIHVIIFDAGGKFSGVAGSILERYAGLSFSTTEKNEDGTTNYVNDKLNTTSYYIRLGTKDLIEISQSIANTESIANGKDWITNYIRLGNGDDAFASMGLDDDITAYDLYKDPEQCEAPIIIGNARSVRNDGGLPNSVLANYIIQNIAEIRKDSMAYFSCRRESVVNNARNEVREILRDAATMPSSSYGEMDSGWKYMYDRYNDRYIWIPTSGDHAGCYARTDRTNEAWYSGAGEQRGRLSNLVKLAFNPNESQRDQIYSNRVNPVVTFPNIGTMLYGDKTLLSLNSSFNRIPTRRLFIVLEKTLSKASRFALFEFNDEITRSQVRAILESYLSEVKSRRGVSDYRVIVDDTVNTSQVVANNEFKGRILIKPNYSINYIELNFVNIGSILTFEESINLL